MAQREYKIRLPGTVTPVVLQAPVGIKGKELIQKTVETFQLPNITGRRIVVSPTARSPGRIVPEGESLELGQDDDLLELWAQPYLLNVAIATSTSHSEVPKTGREIAADFSAPLMNQIPVFQTALKLGNEEFLFKAIDAANPTSAVPEGPKVRWLNSNLSLIQQGFGEHTWLVIVPKSVVIGLYSSLKPEKEGFLLKKALKDISILPKGVISATLKTANKNQELYTLRKKHYFVLCDSFLFYFKSKEENRIKPKGVIFLEHYAIRLLITRKVTNNGNNYSIVLKRNFGLFGKSKSEIVLESDETRGVIDVSSEVLREWVEVLKKKCMPTTDTKVFGVDLKELMARSPKGSPIPEFIRKAVSYIDCNGLEMEGLFRLSGSASLIEYYKDQFDQGISVDINLCKDVHTIAGLLKLYLRELPEPLTTFDLYTEFIESHSKGVEGPERIQKLGALLAKLPEENQIILKYLCAFLARVVEFSSVNKMSKENLGIVFGPNLIRSRNADGSTTLTDNPIINELIKSFIDEYKTLFHNVGILKQEKEKPTPPERGQPRAKALPTPPESPVVRPSPPPQTTRKASPAPPPRADQPKEPQTIDKKALTVDSIPTKKSASHSNILESQPMRPVPKTNPLASLISPPPRGRGTLSLSAESIDLQMRFEQLNAKLEEEIRSRTSLEGIVKRLDKLLNEETQKRIQLEKKVEQLLNGSTPAPASTATDKKKKMKALYDYNATEQNELSFAAGDVITVQKEHDSGWWLGTVDGKTQGLFPIAYTSPVN